MHITFLRWCCGQRAVKQTKRENNVMDNVHSSGYETPAILVLNAAKRDTEAGVTVSPGCCAEKWDTPTHRRVKTCSAADLFVSYLFARLGSSHFCSRFSTGKTTSRGKCWYFFYPTPFFSSATIRKQIRAQSVSKSVRMTVSGKKHAFVVVVDHIGGF